MRHSLSDDSTRASIILGSWAKVDGLLPEADILKLLRNRTLPTSISAVANESNTIVID
jgi:hypothetical protein